MNDLYRRFVNRRMIVILFIVSVAAFYIYLDSGSLMVGTPLKTYEQVTLHTDKSCDITTASCKSVSDKVNIELRQLDNPGALKPFLLEVLVDGINNADDAKILVSFDMKDMSMGQIKHKLVREENKAGWSGKVVLPLCTSGRSDWTINIEVIDSQNIYLAEFPLQLAK